jgi:phage baseplate assembly protein W
MSESGPNFLGVGWSFPLELVTDPTQPELGTRVAEATYEELVQQAIWIVLATAPGERVARPDFGCGIHEFVFANDTASTRAAIGDAIRGALLRWEPRIDLLDVEVQPQPEEPATLLIGIDYRVRSTNNVFNLVYPFYLGGGAS